MKDFHMPTKSKGLPTEKSEDKGCPILLAQSVRMIMIAADRTMIMEHHVFSATYLFPNASPKDTT